MMSERKGLLGDAFMEETKVGKVERFFRKPMVAAVSVETGSLNVGEAIHIRGRTTDLHARITSMELDGTPVDSAGPGECVGIALSARARARDEVYKIKE